VERNNPKDSEISEDEWAAEVARLSAKSGGQALCVQIRWSFGHLQANACQLQVSDRTFHADLYPRSPAGGENAGIVVSLPKPYHGRYDKHTSKDGEIYLGMAYPLGEAGHYVDYALLEIATTWAFLDSASSGVQVQ
jgi:hypothetical protein